MIKTIGQIKKDLGSIDLRGKNEIQKNNYEILKNWVKSHSDNIVVPIKQIKEIDRRINLIKKDFRPMNSITKNKIKTISEAMSDILINLYARWQDEKQYEDWQDYVSVISKAFSDIKTKNNMSDAIYFSCQKRPFGITFDFEGFRITIKVTSTRYGWEAEYL